MNFFGAVQLIVDGWNNPKNMMDLGAKLSIPPPREIVSRLRSLRSSFPSTPSSSKTDSFILGCPKPNMGNLQDELREETLKNSDKAYWLGAPEVLALGGYLIRHTKCDRVLDIGTYTGASALAWALAVPAHGQVWTVDVDQDPFIRHGLPIIRKAGNLLAKLIPIEGTALAFLDGLLNCQKEESFDFAFIDADKDNYYRYYEKTLQLLRKGGIMMINLSLHGEEQARTVEGDHLLELKEFIADDRRTASFNFSHNEEICVAFKL